MCFAWQAQGFRHVAKYVAGAGVREGCKNVGRRGGCEEGLKRCVSRGRRSDFGGQVSGQYIIFEGSLAKKFRF